MQIWKRVIGISALVLCIACMLSASGCGRSENATELPDNYRLIHEGPRQGWVLNPQERRVGDLVVLEVNWQDWFVFGRSSPVPSHDTSSVWFILNTSSGTLDRYSTEHEWKRQLDRHYIFHTALKSHSDLRRERTVFFSFIAALGVIWIGAIVVWFYQKRRARQDRPDRL